MTRVLRPGLAGLLCASLLLPAGCTPFGKDEAKGPTYPKAWDARVVPYVKLAEKLRDLEFKHPVTVEFQTPKAFAKGSRPTRVTSTPTTASSSSRSPACSAPSASCTARSTSSRSRTS